MPRYSFFIFHFPKTSMNDQFKIYDTKMKQVIMLDKIITDCREANVLFFGEDHNDSAGHFLEDTLFKLLHKAYNNNKSYKSCCDLKQLVM